MNTVAANLPALVDQQGNPLRVVAPGTTGTPAGYKGDRFNKAIAAWQPRIKSADGEVLPHRDTDVARSRDITGGYGFAAGAVQSLLDQVIGATFRLHCTPDYMALGQSREWAREWAREVENRFWLWANDANYECDVTRRQNFVGLMGLAARCDVIDGEALVVAEWLPERRYATAINVIDPDRLSNPQRKPNGGSLRAGVELGELGEPAAYHIRTQHPGDWPVTFLRAGDQFQWRRVTRETSFGRPQVLHHFDVKRPGQTRGQGKLAPILAPLKMLDDYKRAELEAAIVNTLYAMVITSELPHLQVADAMGVPSDGGMMAGLQGYIQEKCDWHEELNIQFDGVKIPHLLPGETLQSVNASHPNQVFEPFERAILREIAAGTNQSYETVSRDYSQTSYASARAAMLESWRNVTSLRLRLSNGIATPIFRLWLEEAMDRGDVQTPPGAPAFNEAITAYTRCTWRGPKRGQIDSLRETKSDQIKLKDLKCTTLEALCAAEGNDWEDVLEQQAREQAYAKELGLSSAPPAMSLPVGDDPDDDEPDEEEDEPVTTESENVGGNQANPRARGGGQQLELSIPL